MVGTAGWSPRPTALSAGCWSGISSQHSDTHRTESRNIRGLAGAGILTVRCGAGHGESRNHELRSSWNATVASGCRSCDFIDQQAGGRSSGVAVSGTVVAASRVHGMDFTTATHAIWWVMTACGAVVLALGFGSNTAWARSAPNGWHTCLMSATESGCVGLALLKPTSHNRSTVNECIGDYLRIFARCCARLT
jgi:hypothetical protein